jgi:hypothetical protein
MTTTVQVFEPALCGSTGFCGPSIAPQRIGFTAERFNLAQQPKAFVDLAAAKQALESKGESTLPLVVGDGTKKSSGTYPSREPLAEWTYVTTLTAKSAELTASSGGCCGSRSSGYNSKKSKCCC